MWKHIESEGYMATIIDGKCINSKDFIADAWGQLKSARNLLALHDAEAMQVACDKLESLIDSFETNLANSKISALDPEITAFSSEYEQKEIQMYLYVYGECTATQIYNHLRTHYEYRGTMPPYITRSEVHKTLKQMITSGLLRSRRLNFKVFYSLTAFSKLMLDSN